MQAPEPKEGKKHQALVLAPCVAACSDFLCALLIIVKDCFPGIHVDMCKIASCAEAPSIEKFDAVDPECEDGHLFICIRRDGV